MEGGCHLSFPEIACIWELMRIKHSTILYNACVA